MELVFRVFKKPGAKENLWPASMRGLKPAQRLSPELLLMGHSLGH